ncbi:MAG: RidA family protein [Gammaproteobacteria bacterium]|nr:RidA family protein [Gammaproteobacteria bacterium]MDH3464509.1 RidA family protein [Gammaproteobacteria bacterium]
MKRQNISSGSRFEELYGYSRAVAVGEMVFVSGTVGFDYETHTVSDDPAEQTHQAFRNIQRALEDAGSSLADVVQIVTYYANQGDWDAIGAALNEWLKDVRPVNAGVCTGFVDPKIKVEISATAIRNCGTP